jgi:type II secretory pathway pseudopilin PulG
MNLVIDRQRHIRQQGFTLLELLLVITLLRS